MALAGSAPAAPVKNYMGYVGMALDALAAGRTQESADCLKQALACNANDPLARVALGLTLLCGGRAEDAAAEFDTALRIEGASAEAEYGIGLIHLSRKQFGPAASAFCQAQATNTSLDMQGTIEYVKALAAGQYAAVADDRGDESLLAINASALMAERRYPEAAAIWKQLQEKAAAPGFRERAGVSMTLVRAVPVALAGSTLDKTYKPDTSGGKKLPEVSGRVSLKADLTKARAVAMVTFFVDNKLAGVTNQPPFTYSWDTTRVANGPHTIRIRGCDADGMVLTEKSAEVLVRNTGTNLPSPRTTGPEAAKLWARLWDALRLKPSAAAINYNLALCAIEEGDTRTATAALERVMAADPDYLDANSRLSLLYRAEDSYARLHQVETTSKTIALTFDDGPKEHTTKLLDALKSKDVRATFFVVGKQAEAYPELVRRMAAEGHDVQNHTYNHRDLEYLSDREIKQEIFKTTTVVRSLTGERTRFLRPPGGHEGNRLPGVMKQFGMTTALWTVNCSKVEGTTRDKLTDHVLSSAEPGAIVLMHNLDVVTLTALPGIIDRLRNNGYTFAPLSELVGKGDQ